MNIANILINISLPHTNLDVGNQKKAAQSGLIEDQNRHSISATFEATTNLERLIEPFVHFQAG
jgi:hypothetical protein